MLKAIRCAGTARRLACGATLACALGLAAPLAAQEQQTKVTAAMSQQVYKELQAAQELVENKQYPEALAVLEKVRARSRLSDYEAAQAWNYTAYTLYLQERYKEAIAAYNQVLKQEKVPEAIVSSTLTTLSQLYFTIEDYHNALATVQRLVRAVAQPSADVYLLLGQAHFQLQQYREALDPVRKGIELYRAQGKPPKENWLLLLRVIHYELKDYPAMAAVLKELVQLYPREQYLRTLAGAYSEMGDTRKQLAVMEALYDGGYLTAGRDVVNLANLFLLHEVPLKAARVLDKAVADGLVEAGERNLRLLSQAWYQAREYEAAIAPLQRAAELSTDGELSLRLAQSYINLERWDHAARALQAGLRKGGLKRPDQAYVMLGMAQFNLNQLEPAGEAFAEAAKDQRSRKVAQQWLAYVAQERERRDALASVTR